jgi:hypothetical protein
MSFDTSRLYSTLLTSRLQQDNPALYQIIYQLIGALSSAQQSINSFVGLIDSSDTNNNVVNNIYQIITSRGGGESNNRPPIPGLTGPKGDTGASGASLPGPLGIIKHYVETYPRYVPFPGPVGSTGATGAQGPLGSFINIRNYEVYKRTIQLFQGSSSPTSSGALTYLGTQTTAGAAQLDFTSLISATYNKYIFDFENVLPATDNADLLMRTSTNNGSSYDAGGSDYAYADFVNNTGSFSTDDVCSAAASSIKIAPTMDNGSTTGGFNGSLSLFNPLNASQYKSCDFKGSAFLNDNQFYSIDGSGWRLATADIDAVRFLMSSGNIIGTIRMYGVVKS